MANQYSIDSLLYIGSPPHSKRCSMCRKYKKFEEYSKNRNNRFGIQVTCKVCQGERSRKHKSREDMFWKRFHAKTVKVGNCIEWQGRVQNTIPFVQWQGRQQSLRRVVYKLAIGELTEDQRVIVTCRNKRCVRHSHMQRVSLEEFYTHAHKSPATGDQIGLKLRGKRNGSHTHPECMPRGKDNGTARLTELDVPIVFELAATGMPQRKIAAILGVAQTTISKVILRKTWAYVPIQVNI